MESWKELAQQLLWEMTPQDNSHGSGAIFDKFNKRFIGSGQGAKSHGYGWYSADDPITGARYVLEKGKPIDFNGVKYDKIVDVWNAARQGIDVTPKSKYLYRVNVPNANFLLDEGLPLNKQSSYVQRAIRNLASDLPNKKFYINAPQEVMYDMKITDSGKYFYDDLVYLLGKQEKGPYGYVIGDTNQPHKHGKKRASELLSRYGIKGIRAYGLEDGPINVTFADSNIKMANTPLQRFMNRIPVETLSKIAEKIGSNPVVKVGGKVLEKTAVPLTILDMLQSPVSSGSLPFEGDYNTIRQDFMPLSQRYTPLTAPQNPLLLQGGIKYNDYR